jgi:hypothetical protein
MAPKESDTKSPAKRPATRAATTAVQKTPRKRASSAKRGRERNPAAAGTDPNPVSRESSPPAISAEERYKLIAHHAYLRAERRGFAPGNEVDDWLQAESEVEQLLRRG